MHAQTVHLGLGALLIPCAPCVVTGKDLKQRLHERIARDLSHFRGKIRLYQVWKGALHWKEWIDRCGESLFFDAYRWAQQADPSALLCPSEAEVITTLTLHSLSTTLTQTRRRTPRSNHNLTHTPS